MATILDRDHAPSHLFGIPELDFSGDLFGERVGGPWFRLGARTITPQRDESGVENVVSRQSLLLAQIVNHVTYRFQLTVDVCKAVRGEQEAQYSTPTNLFSFTLTP